MWFLRLKVTQKQIWTQWRPSLLKKKKKNCLVHVVFCMLKFQQGHLSWSFQQRLDSSGGHIVSQRPDIRPVLLCVTFILRCRLLLSVFLLFLFLFFPSAVVCEGLFINLCLRGGSDLMFTCSFYIYTHQSTEHISLSLKITDDIYHLTSVMFVMTKTTNKIVKLQSLFAQILPFFVINISSYPSTLCTSIL